MAISNASQIPLRKYRFPVHELRSLSLELSFTRGVMLLFLLGSCVCGSHISATSYMPDTTPMLQLANNLKAKNVQLDPTWQSVDCCKWEGIACGACANTNSSRCVTSINLSGDARGMKRVDLVGMDLDVIAVPLSNLSSLRYLNLTSTGVTGNITDHWASLITLQILRLSRNALAGVVPLSLGSLVALKELDICSNSLEGELPPSWQSLHNLEILLMANNTFSGPLPGSWSKLVALRQLELHDNSLTGEIPLSWSQLGNLEWFKAHRNSLNGSLPDSFAQLHSLTEFTVFANELRGRLPDSWGSLTNLRYIDVSHNQIGGEIPAQWSGMTALVSMFLSHNSLAGTLPGAWGGMAKLEKLFLDSNLLEGSIPPEWSGMQALLKLNLTCNRLVGNIPGSFRNLERLNYLGVASNKLSGSLYASSIPSRLVTLELSANNLTGPLAWFRNIPDNLYVIDVSFNQFDLAPISQAFLTLPRDRDQLVLLHLEGMRFTCPYPSRDDINQQVAFTSDGCIAPVQDVILPIAAIVTVLFILLGIVTAGDKRVRRALIEVKGSWELRVSVWVFQVAYSGFDIINDAFSFKNILNTPVNESDPCTIVNDKKYFESQLPNSFFNNEIDSTGVLIYTPYPERYHNGSKFIHLAPSSEYVTASLADLSNYSDYAGFMSSGWPGREYPELVQQNNDSFASLCSELLFNHDSSMQHPRCVFNWQSNTCYMTHVVRSEANERFQRLLFLSIFVYILKEVAKLLVVLFMLCRGPVSRRLRYFVRQSVFVSLLACRRDALVEVFHTQEICRSSDVIMMLFVDRVGKNIPQLMLIAYYALEVSQQGWEANILISIVSNMAAIAYGILQGIYLCDSERRRLDERKRHVLERKLIYDESFHARIDSTKAMYTL